jgi:hypothetical protein
MTAGLRELRSPEIIYVNSIAYAALSNPRQPLSGCGRFCVVVQFELRDLRDLA